MNKLAVRIQHIPKRERWAKYLAQMLNENRQPQNKLEIITDEKYDLWTGAKKTLQSYKPGDTHLLVLQDDILPCKDLIFAAEQIVELLPNNHISLFSIGDWQTNPNVRWANLKTWRMAQCYIAPVTMIEDFIKWADRHIKPEIYFDDDRWAMYLFANSILTYASNPSLVEHLGWNQSTLTGYQPGTIFEPRIRMAKNFIGFEKSAMDIDWSQGIDKPLLINEGTWSEFDHNYLP